MSISEKTSINSSQQKIQTEIPSTNQFFDREKRELRDLEKALKNGELSGKPSVFDNELFKAKMRKKYHTKPRV